MKYFDPQQERALIRRAQRGDRAAANELLLGCLPFVRNKVAHRYSNLCTEDLDDLCQELFIELQSCVPKYELARTPHTRFYNFANRTICSFVTKYLCRVKGTHYQLDDGVTDGPLETYEESRSLQLLRLEVAKLPQLERSILSDRKLRPDPITLDALAALHGCSRGHIANVEARALDKLALAMAS